MMPRFTGRFRKIGAAFGYRSAPRLELRGMFQGVDRASFNLTLVNNAGHSRLLRGVKVATVLHILLPRAPETWPGKSREVVSYTLMRWETMSFSSA